MSDDLETTCCDASGSAGPDCCKVGLLGLETDAEERAEWFDHTDYVTGCKWAAKAQGDDEIDNPCADCANEARGMAVQIKKLCRDIDKLLARDAKRKRFPIQRGNRGVAPHPLTVSWETAELAYSVYSAHYGRGQSLERLAQRGGFGPEEMDAYLPDWRERESREVKVAVLVEAVITTVNEAHPFAKPPAISGHYFGDSSWVKIEDVTRLLKDAIAAVKGDEG